MDRRSTVICMAVFVGAIWLAFCGTGLLIHRACRDAPNNHLGWTDVAGYDSEGLVTHYTSPSGIMEVNHRHPLMALVASPITLVGLMVTHRVGLELGYQAVICCFAFVGSLTCLLLWLVLKKAGATPSARLAALALWFSFAHVWLLGGIAESFGISMAIMLGVLLMVLYGVRDARAWIGACALAGGTTVTNAVKPLVAWFVAADGVRVVRRMSRRTVANAFAELALLLLFAAGCLAVKWTFVDGIGVSSGIDITVKEVAGGLSEDLSWSRRLWLCWNAFWCEPMMLREGVIAKSVIVRPYATAFPHLLGAAVLALCAWSAMRNFRLPVVRAALSMVVFDFLLHVVIGWGLAEGQIYCGHWFWIIPLLVSLLPGWTSWLAAAIAVGIALNNLGVVFLLI